LRNRKLQRRIHQMTDLLKPSFAQTVLSCKAGLGQMAFLSSLDS
jgi:hypothetical protein